MKVQFKAAEEKGDCGQPDKTSVVALNFPFSPGNVCKLCPDKSLVEEDMIPTGLFCNLIHLQSGTKEQMATQRNDHSIEWKLQQEAFLDLPVD